MLRFEIDRSCPIRRPPAHYKLPFPSFLGTTRPDKDPTWIERSVLLVTIKNGKGSKYIEHLLRCLEKKESLKKEKRRNYTLALSATFFFVGEG